MRLFKYILFTLSVLLVCQTVKGQYFTLGQAPASTTWSFIETRDFKIIYPEQLEKTAAEAAFQFQSNSENVSAGLRTRSAKTPVILHPRDVISNAYAIWAPRRIEVLTTPPQRSYAQPWMNQLALHEYRHIIQLSKMNQGITRGLSYLFGQQVHAVSVGLFVPSWFLEGDAVTTETLFSKSGRGRVPAFSQTLRAQLAEKGPYTYQKAALGSYKNFVPDIYTTGYHIVAFGRERYGPDIWNSALDAVARKPFLITPFNYGLKKISGVNKKGLYNEMVKDLAGKWGGRQYGDAQHLLIADFRPEEYVSYLNPVQTDDSTVIALKTSMSKTPEIVKISLNGTEETLHKPGFLPDNLISYNGEWLVWAEYRPHVRWQTVSYTDILLMNPATGEIIRRSFNRKLFAPSASANGAEIVAIEYGINGDAFITIIAEAGRKFLVPDGIHPVMPVWEHSGKSVIFIAIDHSGKRFMKLDIESGEFSDLSAPEYSEISDPFVADGWLYFTGTVKDKSQILRMNPETKKTEVLTNSAYGASKPYIFNNFLLYSDYTSDGNRIAGKLLKEIEPLPVSKTNPHDWIRVKTLTGQEITTEQDSSSVSVLSSGKYKKGKHLFHIHSWAPVYADVSGETARPGFSVMSQNMLSTMFVTAGYDYDLNEQTGMFRTNVSWKGWFPEIRAGFSTGKRAALDTRTEKPERFTWNETSLDLTVSQSLDFSKGNINKGIFGETSYTLLKITHDDSTPADQAEGTLSALTYRLFAYLYTRQALRDLAPRLGVNTDIRFRHSPFGSLDAGNIAAVQAQVFLPGLLLNHSTGFYAGYQRSHPQKYRFQHIVSTSRGYIMMDRADELMSFKLNYRFPLFYPDLQALGLIYVKRLRANLFHDYTRVAVNTPVKTYQSSGMDLMADFHLFGISIPVSAGARSIYLHNDKDFAFEFLFSVNFYDY